ncbi:U6 small nuclear RNA (adenine-(43)-N(6))-methyltransferase isoform X2 [Harpegnathos saltator]|uniref:U6 small nuclear RNA (adenine-(43)-N(6))-methyltransferase n=2 Tax=Harpegnathos saltator TaxID=610380 RepID=E2BKC6_HARSA|nr:U6 small nuclear RNA (adenine-(43)-N(6))-methyltransferase isoform X2 [Harpegnathos saltator]XP_025156876.1 U6 small nuclear RNA (adenine-(43)-N(6))-methyltransferase isoform X2 [Harpegnathos saltator]EFN83850.1 Putative methyltransferase METT10D [Harpegnathos saltator]
MNYILWIEDLMRHFKLTMDETIGIDIGTGAICVYALLLAKIYKCHMIGTEVDQESVEHAKNCIRRNNLQDLIKIITVNSESIFKDAVEENKVYDFSMCNPPFFENEGNDERVAKTLPPRNAPSGNEGELKTKGGELSFVTRMIEESIELKDQIKIYSTMIGKKIDLLRLMKMIRSKNIENATWTEFCQGYTTRWALAWSFLPKDVMDLTTAPFIRKTRKSTAPLIRDHKTLITFPVKDEFSSMDDVISFLSTTAKELNIKLQEVPTFEDIFDGWVCQLTVREKTWEHARRKRRLAQQLALKKLKNVDGDCVNVSTYTEDTLNAVSVLEENVDAKQADEISLEERLSVRSKEESEESSSKCDPLLTCELFVEIDSPNMEETVSDDDMFSIWMNFKDGSGGLDALQSLKQYLKNRLGVKRTVLHDSSKPVKVRKKSVLLKALPDR